MEYNIDTFMRSLNYNDMVTSNIVAIGNQLFGQGEGVYPSELLKRTATLPVPEKPTIRTEPNKPIANKAYIFKDPSKPMIIPPQYINNALSPDGVAYKYFEKPKQSFITDEYINQLAVQAETIIDPNTNTENTVIKQHSVYGPIDKFVLNDILEQYSSKFKADYIPPEIYSTSWVAYNRQFIINRYNGNGANIPSTSTRIDTDKLNALKQLYPNVNEKILRADYNRLLAKHCLLGNNESNTIIDFVGDTTRKQEMMAMISNNIVIAKLESLLFGISSEIVDKTIKNITEPITDQLIFNKFTNIGRNIIKRDIITYKLAFVCGSTTETIVSDIQLIIKFMRLKYGVH